MRNCRFVEKIRLITKPQLEASLLVEDLEAELEIGPLGRGQATYVA